MSLTITYEYKCNWCNHSIKESHNISPPAETPKPHPPTGWHRHDNGFICNRHKIIIQEAVTVYDDKWLEMISEKYKMRYNTTIATQILRSLNRTEGQCPCVPKLFHNDDTKCPCKTTREGGECHCGLFSSSTNDTTRQDNGQ